jgi:hypothetical protein
MASTSPIKIPFKAQEELLDYFIEENFPSVPKWSENEIVNRVDEKIGDVKLKLKLRNRFIFIMTY